MTQPGRWPWEQEQEPEGKSTEHSDVPATAVPDVQPPTPAPDPIPFPGSKPYPPMSQDPPFALIQEDAMGAIISFIQEQGADRGPFKLERDGQQNQQLPGLSIPPWFMQVLNYLCGHPLLPYNHDRPTMQRDLLFMAAASLVQVVQQYQDSEELRNTKHIIAHESTLRRSLYEEEMLQNHFTEDLAVVARALELRMDAGQRKAVYDHLKQLFDFIGNIRDKGFWKPTFLHFAMQVPEIQHAIKFVGEAEEYHHDPEFRAWVDMMNESESQRRDWDEEYG